MGYQSVFRRYEKKYLVTQEQYDRLAKVFAPRMERDRFSESTISNIYYDTPDFRLIRRSLDQPVYKEKLRLRTYRTPHADTEAFVEIKKKYDHVVYKRRIGMNYQQAVDYLDGARGKPDLPGDRLVLPVLRGTSAGDVHLLRPACGVRP